MITFLEGQFELASNEIAADPEFAETARTQYGLSCMNGVDKNVFDLFKIHKLRKTVRRVYEHSRFYRNMFDRAGIVPEDIRSFEDLRIIPYTFPDDLRGNSYDFLCISERHVERPVSFYSSGTTGMRKRIFFSFSDIERIKAFIGIAMNSIADTEDTRILSLMTNSQGRGASSLFVDSVSRRGMTAFAGNMEDGAEEILRVSMENSCNVWFGDIGTIYRSARELEHDTDLRSLGLKLLYVTMGNVSAPVRSYLKEAFGCEVVTHYGFTEAGWGFAIEQPGKNGYYSNELDIYTEVVDPDTGEMLPDGTEGELTFTIIGREAMPLLRYRSGDIADIRRAGNGNELDTIGFIRRRLEGTLVTESGSLVTPPMIEDIIFRFPEVIDYRLYCEKRAAGTHGIMKDRISIEIETVDHHDGLEAELSEALDCIPGIAEILPAEIKVVPPGTLKKYCYEKKHFIQPGVERDA